MQLHELIKKTISARTHRVGRGGKRGKTSGRGGKGQTARAGNKPRPQWRDIIKKIPKRRGYGENRGRTVVPEASYAVVNLSALNAHFHDGDTVTPRALLASGLVRKSSGKMSRVKILSTGALDKKLIFENVIFSEKARAVALKAGGTIKD